MKKPESKPIDPVLLAPILRTGPGYWLTVAALSAVVAWGIYAWVQQIRAGLGVTGMNTPVYWGLYITNFVFFIGISHAGTLISAILRIAGAEWRRPITRAAEAVTVFALILALTQIIADMGRPERLLNLIFRGRLQSPLLWDVLSVGVYLLGCITYLYLPLLPDLALLRDQLPLQAPAWRRQLYRILALGWHGSAEQRHRLEKAIGVMAIFIIPIAVSVHTVVSWVFAMTLRPMWHSTIFGPYFVIGAIYSGIATIILAMALIRKVWHLESYLKPLHFNYLALLLVAFNALWFYFTFAEYLTTGYGSVPVEMAVFGAKLGGEFRLLFWGMVISMALAFAFIVFPRLLPAGWVRVAYPRLRPVTAAAAGALLVVALLSVQPPPVALGLSSDMGAVRRVLVPALLIVLFLGSLVYLKGRMIAQAVVASLLVDVGMWLERFTIVVPTETRPMQAGYLIGIYHPTWVEWAITAAAFAAFVLIYLIFIKLFPIISIWEVQEASEAIPATVRRLRTYLPERIGESKMRTGGD